MIYTLIGCLIIIGFLGFKLFQKQKIDRNELEKYKVELEQTQINIEANKSQINEYLAKLCDLQIQCNDARNERICEESHTASVVQAADEALKRYHDIVDIKMKELDNSIEEQRQKRQEELDNIFNMTKANYDLQLEEYRIDCQKQAEQIRDTCIEADNNNLENTRKIREQTEQLRQQFEGIKQVLKTYDAEQQQKIFYTVQLPEEYQEDIEFLLTTVAAKVQHPDIISKLVWQEYVKPNLENTFKRIEIKAEPGIYKLTSLLNGKCYIGKSTNVKNRITDHFKSVVGITSIADQAVHHAIRKEGFWNWTIEVIIYCDKDRLSELEKYYIEFFKAQEYGYNRTQGG